MRSGSGSTATGTSGAQKRRSKKSSRATKRWLYRSLVAVSLSYLTLFEKLKFAHIHRSFGNWEAWQFKATRGGFGAPLRYRWLSTWIAEGIRRLGLSAYAAHMVVRYVCGAATFVLLDMLWVPWLNQLERLLGSLSYALITALSTLPMPQPAEPLNIVCFTAAYLAMARRKWLLVYLIVSLGASNKLTPVFVAPVAFFFGHLLAQQRKAERWKAWVHGASLLAVAVLMRLAIMAQMGYRGYEGAFWQFQANLRWLQQSFAGWNFLLVTLGPAAAVWIKWKHIPTLLRAHSLMIPLFVAGHVAITLIAEFRTALVTLPLGIPALLLIVRGHVASNRLPKAQQARGERPKTPLLPSADLFEESVGQSREVLDA